ncbi:hypothetical protein [Rhizobium sp. C4]|uniref:hypothetical protein n=1 Tax=Rhizobium sp. C4 TaxID=1349800 RepID=UPI001E461A95|nr:hypothetical protein [Rhizobium sp. C4]MCD2176056.1 hypothetical protein [Rhizobium sp. C4]
MENFARYLEGKSPVAMHEIKKLVCSGCDLTREEGLSNERQSIARVLAYEDYAEGVCAFIEKRSRIFRGR